MPLRFSNLQAATFSSATGLHRGEIHRHRNDGQLYWPETPLRPALLAGTGDEHGADEVCVSEINAVATGATSAVCTAINQGHPGPQLSIDISAVELPFDATSPHTWTRSEARARRQLTGQREVRRRIS